MLAQSTDHASKSSMVYAILKDRSATATMSMMWNKYLLCTQPWPVPVDILSNNMNKMTMYAQAKGQLGQLLIK